MKRSCKSLKYGEPVVFLIHSNIYNRKIPEWGTVVEVTDEYVEVSWMEGFRERFNRIPLPDMLAVHSDEPNAEVMHFENIYGPSDLLVVEGETNG